MQYYFVADIWNFSGRAPQALSNSKGVVRLLPSTRPLCYCHAEQLHHVILLSGSRLPLFLLVCSLVGIKKYSFSYTSVLETSGSPWEYIEVVLDNRLARPHPVGRFPGANYCSPCEHRGASGSSCWPNSKIRLVQCLIKFKVVIFSNLFNKYNWITLKREAKMPFHYFIDFIGKIEV